MIDNSVENNSKQRNTTKKPSKLISTLLQKKDPSDVAVNATAVGNATINMVTQEEEDEEQVLFLREDTSELSMFIHEQWKKYDEIQINEHNMNELRNYMRIDHP